MTKRGIRNQFVVCPTCGARLLERHYRLHHELCGSEGWNSEAQQGKASSAHKRKRTLPNTEDGYITESCPACGHRVCVVPDGGYFQVFDIVHNRKSSVPHQCSGSETDSRRTKLIYVNSKVGTIR